MKDISDLFGQTHSNLIRDILDRGGVVLGMKVENFAGVLLENEALALGIEKRLEETTKKKAQKALKIIEEEIAKHKRR